MDILIDILKNGVFGFQDVKYHAGIWAHGKITERTQNRLRFFQNKVTDKQIEKIIYVY